MMESLKKKIGSIFGTSFSREKMLELGKLITAYSSHVLWILQWYILASYIANTFTSPSINIYTQLLKSI